MSRLNAWIKRLPLQKPWVRPALITLIVLIVIVQEVALTPSSLDTTGDISQVSWLEPEALKVTRYYPDPPVASEFPEEEIPAYRLKDFQMVSSEDGQKQWKMLSEQTFFFNEPKTGFGRKVTISIYDTKGEATLITANESKYTLTEKKKSIELFEKVVITLPDGFQILSPYLLYRPDEHEVLIPENYYVEGKGIFNQERKIEFQSQGLRFETGTDRISLLKDVVSHFERVGPPKPHNAGIVDVTQITADQCTLFRNQQVATYSMNPKRPEKERFVVVLRKDLYVRSRTVDLRYGSSKDVLNYMTAYGDVLMQERMKGSSSEDPILRYGTCGQLDFDTRKNVIVLTEFPQVYQNKDTVTGERILVHRDTDVVEVEYSNAFSEGR